MAKPHDHENTNLTVAGIVGSPHKNGMTGQLVPLPVTRFNFGRALQEARQAGEHLIHTLRAGVEPFPSLGAAMVHYEALPHMRDTPLDELRLIVEQLKEGLPLSGDRLVRTLHAESAEAEAALLEGDRAEAAEHLSNAYEAGNQAWREQR
jgi:hypothetical protein